MSETEFWNLAIFLMLVFISFNVGRLSGIIGEYNKILGYLFMVSWMVIFVYLSFKIDFNLKLI